MRAMGIEGDMPGYSQPGKASVSKPKRPRDTATIAAIADDLRRTGSLDGKTPEPAEPDDAIENVEPVDAETAEVDDWYSRAPTSLGSFTYELRITKEGTDPFKAGYAQGYAVAVLRLIATIEGLDGRLADMASDAADGLMA